MELPEEKRKILEEIARNPGITIPQLARALAKSEKTITNHLTELKKLNLVITRGKTNNLYTTKLGNLITKTNPRSQPPDSRNQSGERRGKDLTDL